MEGYNRRENNSLQIFILAPINVATAVSLDFQMPNAKSKPLIPHREFYISSEEVNKPSQYYVNAHICYSCTVLFSDKVSTAYMTSYLPVKCSPQLEAHDQLWVNSKLSTHSQLHSTIAYTCLCSGYRSLVYSSWTCATIDSFLRNLSEGVPALFNPDLALQVTKASTNTSTIRYAL